MTEQTTKISISTKFNDVAIEREIINITIFKLTSRTVKGLCIFSLVLTRYKINSFYAKSMPLNRETGF